MARYCGALTPELVHVRNRTFIGVDRAEQLLFLYYSFNGLLPIGHMVPQAKGA